MKMSCCSAAVLQAVRTAQDGGDYSALMMALMDALHEERPEADFGLGQEGLTMHNGRRRIVVDAVAGGFTVIAFRQEPPAVLVRDEHRPWWIRDVKPGVCERDCWEYEAGEIDGMVAEVGLMFDGKPLRYVEVGRLSS